MRYAEMVSHRKRRLAEHCWHAGTSCAIVESVDKLCDIPQAGYRNTGLSTIHPHSMSSCQSFGADTHTLHLPSEIAYRAPYKTSRHNISPYQLTTPRAC